MEKKHIFSLSGHILESVHISASQYFVPPGYRFSKSVVAVMVLVVVVDL